MAESAQSEERYPLLFLFLDDGNKSSRRNRNILFERSRSQGIMSGATTVLTQWPGHLSSCGLAMVVIAMTVFFFFLMLIASSIKPVTNSLHPRCIRRGYDVFETNLFLIHDDSSWQQNELDTLEHILLKYQQCEIQLLILRRENLTNSEEGGHIKYGFQPLRPKRQTKGRRRSVPKNKTESKLDLSINIGAKKLLQAFLERRRHLNVSSVNMSSSTTSVPHLPNIGDIIMKFPRMVVRNISESEFFEDSPLYAVWRKFNKDTLIFAARVLNLWENGGISFAIPHEKKNVNITEYYKYEPVQNNISLSTPISIEMNTTIHKNISSKEDINRNNLLESMIEIGYSSFNNLPEGLVTVDEEGIHMETKTICHAFFGEALVQLKHADNTTTVAKIIKNTLKTFCIRGAVDSEYCNNAMY